MIDARDHVGVPTITECPHIVKHEGVTYEAAADIGVLREGDISFALVPEFPDAFDRMWSARLPLITPRVNLTFVPA
jgi:hypothetical protein